MVFIKENLHGEAPNHQAHPSTRVHLCERQVAGLALSEADGCSAKNVFLRVVSCVVTVISQLLLVLARAALA